jgi:hypothetical protein
MIMHPFPWLCIHFHDYAFISMIMHLFPWLCIHFHDYAFILMIMHLFPWLQRDQTLRIWSAMSNPNHPNNTFGFMVSLIISLIARSFHHHFHVRFITARFIFISMIVRPFHRYFHDCALVSSLFPWLYVRFFIIFMIVRSFNHHFHDCAFVS